MADLKQYITRIQDSDGPSLAVAGSSYRILVSGQQTGGSYAVIDMRVPPGSGPGPHAHKDMQEMFYIVDGEVEFKTQSGSQVAGKGALINIPRGGEVHCFKNKSDQVAHLICTVIPAGLDAFFQEIGQPAEAGTFLPPPVLSPEDKERIQALAEKYGQEMYPPDFLG
jgi:quercetin dioxygenase-like cupin family protein